MESWGAERLDATRHIITDYNVISLGKDCGPRPAYKLRALDGQPVSAASLPRGPSSVPPRPGRDAGPPGPGSHATIGVARAQRPREARRGPVRSKTERSRVRSLRRTAQARAPDRRHRRRRGRGPRGPRPRPRGDTNRGPCSPGKRKARVAPPPVRGHGDVITQFEIRVSRAYAATRAPGRGAGHAACVYAMWAGTRI